MVVVLVLVLIVLLVLILLVLVLVLIVTLLLLVLVLILVLHTSSSLRFVVALLQGVVCSSNGEIFNRTCISLECFDRSAKECDRERAQKTAQAQSLPAKNTPTDTAIHRQAAP